MGIMSPRFQAGEMMGEELFFSHIRFNGLFKININTLDIFYITHFENSDLCKKDLHSDSFKYKDWVGFLPGYGSTIDLYNVKTKELKSIKLNRYKNIGEMVCKGHIYGKELWIVPHFLAPQEFELPFLQMNLETFDIEERWDINKKIKKKLNINGELAILSSEMYEKNIWFPIYKTNKIIKFDVIDNECTIYDMEIRELNSISCGKKHIWLSTCSGEIASWNPINQKIEKYENDCGKIRGRAVKRIIETKKSVYALPEFSEYISKRKNIEKCTQFKKQDRIMIKNLFESKATVSNCRYYNNKWYIYPYNSNGIIEIDDITGKIVYKELKEEVFFTNSEEKKEFLASIMKTQYVENKGFTLNDMCLDLLQI